MTSVAELRHWLINQLGSMDRHSKDADALPVDDYRNAGGRSMEAHHKAPIDKL